MTLKNFFIKFWKVLFGLATILATIVTLMGPCDKLEQDNTQKAERRREKADRLESQKSDIQIKGLIRQAQEEIRQTKKAVQTSSNINAEIKGKLIDQFNQINSGLKAIKSKVNEGLEANYDSIWVETESVLKRLGVEKKDAEDARGDFSILQEDSDEPVSTYEMNSKKRNNISEGLKNILQELKWVKRDIEDIDNPEYPIPKSPECPFPTQDCEKLLKNSEVFLSVDNAKGNAKDIIMVKVRVQGNIDLDIIGGLAFTLKYHPNIILDSVKSSFFDDSGIIVPHNYAMLEPNQNSINISYNKNDEIGKVMISASHAEGGRNTGNALLDLYFRLREGVPPGIYEIKVLPTTIVNPEAGYPEETRLDILISFPHEDGSVLSTFD